MPYPTFHDEPDYATWASMPYWTLDEAAALLAGWDPGDAASLNQYDDNNIKIDRISKAIARASEAGALAGSPAQVLPLDVVGWASLQPFANGDLFWTVMRYSFGKDTVAEAEDSGIKALQKENARLRREMLSLQRLPPKETPQAPLMLTAPDEKPLGEKERITFLKMILGMAIQKYKYRVRERNSASEFIKRDLEDVGIALSDDTIRDKLSEAVDKVDVQPT
jgi:hypothetical protein